MKYTSIKKNFFLKHLANWSEKAMATHSSNLAWQIPWTEEPGRLQSMGLLGVGHDWVTSLSLFTFVHWRRKWQPTPMFLPGESQGRASLVGCRLGSHKVKHNWSDLAAAWEMVVWAPHSQSRQMSRKQSICVLGPSCNLCSYPIVPTDF